MKLDQAYNRFQYSEFIGEKGQLVFRADTYAELVAQCKEAGIQLPHAGTHTTTVAQPPYPSLDQEPPHPAEQQAPQPFATRCMIVGCTAPAEQRHGISKKNGKPWNGVFCSVDKEHVKFI